MVQSFGDASKPGCDLRSQPAFGSLSNHSDRDVDDDDDDDEAGNDVDVDDAVADGVVPSTGPFRSFAAVRAVTL